MPHLDTSLPLTLQIRDSLRDQMEANTLCRSVYPAPKAIASLPSDDVSQAQNTLVSIGVLAVDRTTPAGQAHYTNPRFAMTVQQYTDNTASASQAAASDACVVVTETLCLALASFFRFDPVGAGDAGPRWDSLRFLPETTRYAKVPGKFWYSQTFFELTSYNRNAT